MSLGQEGSLVERAEHAPERIVPERTLTLVIEPDNQATISEHEATLQSTLMPHPAIATSSQEIPATPVTTKTLLLLTFGPQFNRTSTPVIYKPAQSLASQSRHTTKLSSEATSNADAFPKVTELQMDLLLTNQHTIMVNQCNLDRRMENLEKGMGKME